MATIRQFNKGEDIIIHVKADAEAGLTQRNTDMYVYPDSLDLTSAGAANKIQKISGATADADGIAFTIRNSITSGMDAGDYTVELKYGSASISIVKQNHAFTLVECGYNIKK